MCLGISLARSELPTELIGRHGLSRRHHDRGAQQEFRFLYRDRRPRLPIWRDGRLLIVRWGNARGQSRVLPRTGWTWLETVHQGGWANSGAIPVDIPATLGLERGRWYRIREGIRGLLVPDERGFAVVYMLCEPSSHYYRVMTGSARMPVLIDERI
ncbi:hypothetical protein TA3x_002882 [Tundrisphaera sp. TA3]|uniref:hypothetical protein n=1 Tax=Tundrisphaera sp. TA3 TaxID=3435775 RepID=UPI003EB872FD